MSLTATSYVIRRPFGGQIKKLIMLVIADFSGDDTGTAWASIDTLAHRAECSRRSVQTHLEELEAAGEIMIYRNGGPEGTHRFRILFKKSEVANPFDSGGANAAPPCKRRTVKQHEGGANDGPPDAPKTGKTGSNGKNIPPQPPLAGGESVSDGVLVARIKNLRKAWQATEHLTAKQQRIFSRNRRIFEAFTAEDWEVQRRFLAKSMPTGSAWFQPEMLVLYLESPDSTLAQAREWSAKHGPAPAANKPPLQGVKPMSAEEQAEMNKIFSQIP
ncbi:helix-turn-helix domain-containing protein [Luteolibacter yonseiensis]|uniref:Helix-turn-helix domain-containing protein n=1 Tax=Luteolibacter yonseiensis TaxID=1144680 RepID=A0A934R7G7_9BACT|nr:helix-turn-helix domain-containing protein [Luteolibacter yonseiensis]MBK1816514.1 helix-turn-helix domain-containing protein [Luteolibacter yonseiensis]